MKSNLHYERWAPGLALKKRPKVIWKWPIVGHVNKSRNSRVHGSKGRLVFQKFLIVIQVCISLIEHGFFIGVLLLQKLQK